MPDWQSLQPLASAVERGDILGFFTTRGPWVSLPTQWSDGSPIARLTVPQGMFLAKEGFLTALGFTSEPQFYQAVTENNLQPQTLALAVACGPFRQRSAGAQFLTVTNGAEPYIVVINADAERPLMTEALQRIFPGAAVQSSLAAPTLQVFPILPPNLRQRFDAADRQRRRFILQFVAASAIACLLILLFMYARMPGWLSIVPLILPYAVFSRSKFELEQQERSPVPKKEETTP